jgi:hypothetical protein
MPLFSISFSPSVADAVDAVALVEYGLVELWPGQWMTAGPYTLQEVIAALRGVRAAAGHLITEVDPARLDALLAFGVSPQGRIFFQESVIPAIADAAPHHIPAARLFRIGEPPARLGTVLDALERTPTLLRQPTPLCLLMLRAGSDKALGWHNYAPLYADLLATFQRPVHAIFELGLGTNNVDVPSNMGPQGVPGASLRAWRTICPDAIIHGADVDKRVLFEEPSIATAYVDQLDPRTFEPMWHTLGETQYDLMIDDGLHTIEAAAITLSNSIDRLAPDGIYVIEDVVASQADAYVELSRSMGLTGALVVLPSLVNTHDNALLILSRIS